MREELFSCGTDALFWKEQNCDRCEKSGFRPVSASENGKETQFDYICKIHREIDLAWVTDGKGGEEAAKACRSSVCPFIEPKKGDPDESD